MKGLLFTYALTYGGAVVALFNPFIGLLIYICFAIVRPESMWYWSVPAGNYSRIVALGLLAGWGLHGFGEWNFGRAKPVVYALLAFWAWALIAAALANDSTAAFGFVEEKSKIFLPFLVGITLIDSIPKLKQVAWVIVLSQGYVAYEMNVSYYSGFNRMEWIGFADMDNNSTSIGMVTAAGVAFFLGLAQEITWRKVLCFVAAALMVHSCMFAFSRGAMLALCCLGAASLCFISIEPRHYWKFAVAVLLALRLAGPEVVERFASTFVNEEQRDTSAQSRLDLWADCWEVTLTNPMVGRGPDNWPLVAHEFGWPAGKEAHSVWFQTGAEMGIPGLALLLAFYGCCVTGLWKFHRRVRNIDDLDPWLLSAGPMVVTSLFGFVVAASFVSLEGLEVPYYVALIGAGTLKVAGHLGTDDACDALEGAVAYPEHHPMAVA